MLRLSERRQRHPLAFVMIFKTCRAPGPRANEEEFSMRKLLIGSAAALAVALSASPAAAQYYGYSNYGYSYPSSGYSYPSYSYSYPSYNYGYSNRGYSYGYSNRGYYSGHRRHHHRDRDRERNWDDNRE